MNTPEDIIRTMQQQNIYTSNTNTVNMRSNAQNGHYRVPHQPGNPGTRIAPPRHMHMPQMFQPNMGQNIVVPSYPTYAPRQPTYTAPQYSFPTGTAAITHPYYSYSPYMQPLPQAPSHQRTNVGINSTVGVGISQGVIANGPNSHLGVAGSQPQQVQLAANAIIANNISSASNNAIGVGNPNLAGAPIVNVMSGNTNATMPTPTRRKHQFRLAIIDPNTNKNILEDIMPGNNSSNAEFEHRISQGNVSLLPEVSETEASTIPQLVADSIDMSVLPVTNSEITPDFNHTSSQKEANNTQISIVSSESDIAAVELLSAPEKIPPIRNLNKVDSNAECISNAGDSEDAQDSAVTEKLLLKCEKNIKSKNIKSHEIFELTQDQNVGTNAKVSVPKDDSSADTSNVQQDTVNQAEVKFNDVEYTDESHSAETLVTVSKSKDDVEDLRTTTTIKLDDLSQQEKIDSECDSHIVDGKAFDAGLDVLENSDSEGPPEISSNEDAPSKIENFSKGNSDISLVKELLCNPLSAEYVPDCSDASLEGAFISDAKLKHSGKICYSRKELYELREAKGSRQHPPVTNKAILPQMNLMPSFARGSTSKRVHSVGNGSGRYPPNDNNGGRQGSMSGMHSRNSAKGGLIHINLSLKQDVKLSETDNAWRPAILQKDVEENDTESSTDIEKEQLVRKVRGILNKLTPEKFDTLLQEIIQLQIDTLEKMEEVVILVFEKAIDEPNYSSSYAKLCRALVAEAKNRDVQTQDNTKQNFFHFRKTLLDKTEIEFTQNVTQQAAKEAKLQPIVDKIKACVDVNERAELQAVLEDEERKIRRRSGGTVRFIGELFLISMLTVKIICHCIDTLLNPQSEDMLECLCKLLTTVGAKYEGTPLHKDSKIFYTLDKQISKMQAMASRTEKDAPKISSRVRFMLQDVIDLRKNSWVSKRNEAPKTMGQIEKETKDAHMTAQYLSYGSSSSQCNAGQSTSRRRMDENRVGSSSGSSGIQRSDYANVVPRRQQAASISGISNSITNDDDNEWHVQLSKGSRMHVDTIKLEGLLKNVDEKKMGERNQFLWNQNTVRQQNAAATPASTQNAFAELSSFNESKIVDRDRNNRKSTSFNKNSNEKERYNDRLSSYASSRDNSNTTKGTQARSSLNSSSMQKSLSQSRYAVQQATRTAAAKNFATLSSPFHIDSVLPTTRKSTSPAVFVAPDSSDIELIKSVLSDFIGSSNSLKDDMCIDFISRIPQEKRCSFLYYILSKYLHLKEVNKVNRRYLGQKIALLVKLKEITVDHFKLSYKEFVKIVESESLLLDVPDLWTYVFQFTGPLILEGVLTLSDLWTKEVQDITRTEDIPKFLKTYLTYCVADIGPNFTRHMWKRLGLKWADFVPSDEIAHFIESNKFEFVENENALPEIAHKHPNEEHLKNLTEHVERLLHEEANVDCIIDYCNGNIAHTDRHFIKYLTTVLCEFATTYEDKSYSLNTESFKTVCIPLFQRFVDAKEELELECLYAAQSVVHSYEHPRGLLYDIFLQLYDGDIIPKDSLTKWRDSKDQSAGKGVAVKSLNNFFNQLADEVEETSDENN